MVPRRAPVIRVARFLVFGEETEMRIIENPSDMRAISRAAKREGLTVGLVPTMGYLHAGHVSLVAGAKRETGVVVVSIFVNPIQFGPNEDFERYPRDMERDKALCLEAGASYIFAPDVKSMYPEGFQTKVSVGPVAAPLCGAGRPGHFDGVATVVTKLFNIVEPDLAFFGEKDYQQLLVIRRMAADLEMGLEIVGMPIVREPDGLAMSSRNVYLSPEERTRALSLSRSLDEAERLAASGETASEKILGAVRGILETAGVAVEYADMRDASTLETVDEIKGPTLIALAARVGRTRLIDNRVLGKGSPRTA